MLNIFFIVVLLWRQWSYNKIHFHASSMDTSTLKNSKLVFFYNEIQPKLISKSFFIIWDWRHFMYHTKRGPKGPLVPSPLIIRCSTKVYFNHTLNHCIYILFFLISLMTNEYFDMVTQWRISACPSWPLYEFQIVQMSPSVFYCSDR